MPCEILSVFIEIKFIVQSAHAIIKWIEAVPSSGVVFLHVLHPYKKTTKTSFLEKAH